jgi:hypothetical protein
LAWLCFLFAQQPLYLIEAPLQIRGQDCTQLKAEERRQAGCDSGLNFACIDVCNQAVHGFLDFFPPIRPSSEALLGLAWKKHRPPAVAAARQGSPLFALAWQRELELFGVIFEVRTERGKLRYTKLVLGHELLESVFGPFVVYHVPPNILNDHYSSQPAESMGWARKTRRVFELLWTPKGMWKILSTWIAVAVGQFFAPG